MGKKNLGGTDLKNFSKFKSLSKYSSKRFDPTATTSKTENIRVAVRVRPANQNEYDYEETVSVLGEKNIILKRGQQRNQLRYDRVFPKEATQEDIYDMAKDTISTVLKGYNATVFAYGQTGTGKTYTMLGIDFENLLIPAEDLVSRGGYDANETYQDLVETKGIIPRSVETLLAHVDRTKHMTKYKLYCSYLEIYNEKIYDLLRHDFTHDEQLEIRQDKYRGLYVKDLTTVAVNKAEDIFKLMETGVRHRSIRSTEMNERSSRSHTIFQLFIEQEPLHVPPHERIVKVSKLNLVDLAGSEKWNLFSKMENERIAEMTSINQSLATLGNCISALMQRGRSHIPFRDSKLTRLLQDSLGGNTKTLFVATISPSVIAFDESYSTLKFADRAMRVQMKTSVNEVVDDHVLIKRYEKEIDRLRSQLRAKHESHANETLREENRKLREDNQKLVAFISKNAQKLQGGNATEVSEADRSSIFAITENQQLSARFNEKLALLEQIEEDQTRREEELEKYHRWLHSIPLHVDQNNEGDKEYSVTVDNKIKLMEQSLKVHIEENERAKKLYLRDLKIMQTEIKEKAEDLEVANEQMVNLKNQLAFQQNSLMQPTAASPNETAAASPSSIQSDISGEDMLPSNNEENRDQQTFTGLLQKYESMKNEIAIKVESGIEFFRKKLTTIILEHIQDEILTHPDASEEEMHEELQTLVTGCCEALNERVVNSQKVFNDQAHAVLKSLYDISLKMGNNMRKERLQLLKRMRQMKKKSGDAHQSTQTSYPLPPVSLSEMVKSSISMNTVEDAKDTAYWNSVVSGVSTMRDFQATLYVRTVALKNTIERIADQVESFTKKEDNLDFHRTQLTLILKHLQDDIKKYEQETFMKQSALVQRSTLLPKSNDKVAALVNAQAPISTQLAPQKSSSETPRTPQHELAQRALGDILDYESPHQVMFRKLNNEAVSAPHSPTTPTIQSSVAKLPTFNPNTYPKDNVSSSPISHSSTTTSPSPSTTTPEQQQKVTRRSPDPASPPMQQPQNISTASLKKRLAEISRDMSKLDTNLRKMARYDHAYQAT